MGGINEDIPTGIHNFNSILALLFHSLHQD
jgi:hypothetical protein